VGYMTVRIDPDKKDKTFGAAMITAAGIVTGMAAVFLVFGYIIKSLM